MALFPWLNFLLKSWHPIEAHWELGLQHVNFEGEHKIQWWSRYKMHAPFQKGEMRKENSDESHASLIHSMANSMKFWSQDILFSLMLCLPDLLEWPFCLCSSAKWGIVPLGPWMVLPSFQWYFLTTIWDLIRMTSTIHISTFSHGFCCIL